MSPALALVAWLAVAGDMPTEPSEPDEPKLPVRCNGTVCLVPQDRLLMLVEANNWKFDRIQELEKQLRAKGCEPKPALNLKTERNS